jgi:hypothetical protein
VPSVRYELGFSILVDSILHSHRRENLKSYKLISVTHIQVSKLTSAALMKRKYFFNVKTQSPSNFNFRRHSLLLHRYIVLLELYLSAEHSSPLGHSYFRLTWKPSCQYDDIK